MTDLKPWQSMSDQLALLKERGLLVDNEQAALEDFGAIEAMAAEGLEMRTDAYINAEAPVILRLIVVHCGRLVNHLREQNT